MKIKLPPEPKFDLDKLLDIAVPTEAVPPEEPGSDTTGSSTTVLGSDTTGSSTTAKGSSTTTPGSVTTGSSTTSQSSDTTKVSSSTTGSDTTKGDRVNEWRKKTKDTIRFDVNHGGKPFLQAQAAKRGLTLTAMIKAALKEFLQNHPL